MNQAQHQIYAVMSGNTVTNIIVADDKFAAGKSDHVRVDNVRPRPGPGWTRSGGRWSPPKPAAPPSAILQQLQALHTLNPGH